MIIVINRTLGITPSIKRQKNKATNIELFAFIDPLSENYWYLEPVIKKLTIEYGNYFTLRYVLVNQYRLQQDATSHSLSFMNHYDKTLPANQEMNYSYYTIFMAIKAAELQGRTLGNSFFRKIQACILLQQPILDMEAIYHIAEETGLDLVEFKKDMNSCHLIQTIHLDVILQHEMKVEKIPSLVFFHSEQRTEGVMITDEHEYGIYTEILQSFLENPLKKQVLPSLEYLMQHYHFLSTTEMMYIYNMNKHDIEKELKHLMLQGKVVMIQQGTETYWRNITQKKELSSEKEKRLNKS